MSQILDEILLLKDQSYRDFQSKLIPTLDKEKMLGLRGPDAKKIAKRYANTDAGLDFMKTLPHKYYDEDLVHGYMLGYLRCESLEKQISQFLPYVNNWAVCDSMVSNLKCYFKDKEKAYIFISKLLQQDKREYHIRFGLVSLLCYYVDDEYIDRVHNMARKIKSDCYYVNMAIAWLVSVCLVKQYEKAIKLIENNELEMWVHNKSIQKATESYRISDEQKNYLRSLKRK